MACGQGQDSTEIRLPELRLNHASPLAFPGLPTGPNARHQAPTLLSETGAFVDAEALDPAPGLMPYDVASPLFSDGALKKRWLSLPAGSSIGFAASGAYDFPVGTVLVKHFGMVLDEREPDRAERLETRFLVANDDGSFYGLTYRWNADQTDADLLQEGLDETLDVVQLDGSVRTQTYSYPGPLECGACHSARVGYAAGPRTAQLNRDREYAATDGYLVMNQLTVWESLGMFDAPLEVSPDELPSLASLDDETRSPEDRVRSYWDGNCSSCHLGGTSWDARYEVELAEQGVMERAPGSNDGDGELALIAPGSPERSVIYLRAESTQPGQKMPPLGRNHVDERYVDLLAEWISNLDR